MNQDIADFANRLAEVAGRIAAGEVVPWDELLPFLCQPDTRSRTQANLALAEALLHRQQAGDLDQATELAARAWEISGFSDKAFPVYVTVCVLRKDVDGVASAYKRLGLRRWDEGRCNEAFDLFYISQYAHVEVLRRDHTEYDHELLRHFRQQAAARPLPDLVATPGERVRLGYLLYGITQLKSIIVRLGIGLMAKHDSKRFEVTCYVPERMTQILAVPHAREALEKIRGLGISVVTAPEIESDSEALWHLAARIKADGTDVLLDLAALADYRRYFLTCLRPAPLIAGYLWGPPSQFVPPHLDFCVGSNRHAQMDCPVDIEFVPGEYELPDLSAIQPMARSALGIPESAFVLAASGRHVKFSAPEFWRGIAEILHNLPHAHFLAIGVASDQVDLTALPTTVVQRIHCTGWRADNLAIVAVADVVIDTYPTGGGYALAEAMAMGIPAMVFRNDYTHRFDPVAWSPIEETIPIPDILFARGDFTAMAAQARRLAEQPDYKRELGERCRATVLAISDPSRSVRSLEEVLLKRVEQQTSVIGLARESLSHSASDIAQLTDTAPHQPALVNGSRRPFFSILVPTYNQAQYLPAALDSLLAQTYTDWEAAVVNDGSTDDTAAVLDAYARRDPRIRAVHKENGGTASALNEALRQSKGQWIGWLSSDDLFEPDKLAAHVEAIRQHPETRFFHTNFYVLDDPPGRKYPGPLDVAKHIPAETHQVIQLFGFNYLNGISIMVERVLFEEVGGFNPRYRGGQDFDMWLRLSARSRSRFIDRRLSTTRQHPGQDTQKSVMIGIIDCGVACLDFLNHRSFAELFPALDLGQVESAVAAIQAVLGIVLDARSNIRTCGFSAPLIERMAEWLAYYPNREFVDALCQMIQESAAEPAVEPEVGVLLQGFAGRVAAATSYRPYDPIDLLGRRAEQLRERGEHAMADTFKQYVEQYKLRMHEAAPSIAPVEVEPASLG